MASAQQHASTSSQASTSGNSSPIPSILDKLRAPTASEIMRKRKVRVNNPPHTGAGKKKPKCTTDPKNVSAHERAVEFKEEMIVVSAGKLFCSACREELSLKLSIIKAHVQSSKHANSKKVVVSNKSRERDISVALNTYEKDVHPSGESLHDAQKVYRVKVITTFLKAGVPLAKLDDFRCLLEEMLIHGYQIVEA